MNFTPVTGSELNNFDEETRQLYSKRSSDVRQTELLIKMNRNSDRNNLPVVSNPPPPWEQHRDAYNKTFGFKAFAFLGFSIFAMQQFSKAYFPLGIILRRSIPTSPMQQLSHRGPIGVLFLYLWYRQREYPRFQRHDLTCESEL